LRDLHEWHAIRIAIGSMALPNTYAAGPALRVPTFKNKSLLSKKNENKKLENNKKLS
jgi:hypothetical protein